VKCGVPGSEPVLTETMAYWSGFDSITVGETQGWPGAISAWTLGVNWYGLWL
jgi:hypothetical protein